ncbi:MAG: prepilin-type N-terminal cleavage/methylation domain-containing protein [Kineosporiaceae bacterium]
MHARGSSRDSGFTLVEVVIAMATFAVLVAFTLALVLRVNQTARQNDLRVAAASLANRQVEAVRGLDLSAIPDGLQTSTATVGSTTYTVRQTARLVAANATASLCGSASSTLAYKLVTVTVSWPNMGSVPAVRADTLKVVGTGALSQAMGTLAVNVASANGAPRADVTVTLSPGGASVVTGDDGCAVFSQVAPGGYTATANTPGYVGASNSQIESVSAIGITAGQVAHADLLYDAATDVVVQPPQITGYSAPSGVPLMIRSTYVTDAQLPGCGTGIACITGFPGQVRSLFPTMYTLWAGNCHDAKTAASAASADLTSATARGSTVTVPMGQVRITVMHDGTPRAGRTLTASHAAEPAATTPPPLCSTGASYALPVSQASGVGVLLPYGTWTLTSQSSPPMTVSVGSTPLDIVLMEN